MKLLSLKSLLKTYTKLYVNKNIKFCFILGSGASKQSGIPTGKELASKWLNEIKQIYETNEVGEWIRKEEIDTNQPDLSYSKIYAKRFYYKSKEGYLELEKLMENCNPSCGYAILSKILVESTDNIVITTNFDTLSEDAIFIYTDKKPLIISHEYLADYINVASNRPLIIKVHRDLFLSPKNDDHSINSMDEKLNKQLQEVFKYYTPIIIGYGGNDGSLMELLNCCEFGNNRPIWCQYGNTNGQLPQHIESFLNAKDGIKVTIEGFDELMLQFGKELNFSIPSFGDHIIEQAKNRKNEYLKQISNILKNKEISSSTEKALESMQPRRPKTPSEYLYRIMFSSDLEKRKILDDALDDFPSNSELLIEYYNFCFIKLGNVNEFEDRIKKALLIDKNNSILNGLYATYLHSMRRNYNKAEIYYKRAISQDNSNAVAISNYAAFLYSIRNNIIKSEELFKKAMQLDPSFSININNYANFLCDVKKDFAKAEELIIKSIDLDPKSANFLGNYAKLQIIKGDYVHAEKLIKRAFDLNRSEKRKDLELELYFYRYAVFYNKTNKDDIEIQKLLSDSVSSPGWDLSELIKIAEKRKHPNMVKVKEYADQISRV